MSDREMERLLKKMVRVLLFLLALAIVGIMAVLWQTPIGGVWRQLFALTLDKVPPLLFVALGIAIALWLAAVILFLRHKRSAETAPVNSIKTNALPETEPPLILEPLYTRKPREESSQ